MAYNAPHTPIQPPTDWLAKVIAREGDIDPMRARLVALIEQMDAGIGEVLDVLKETGLAKETIVVFTSDNGGQLSVGANNGPLRDGKQSMYEGGLKVPTAIVWPGRIQPASRTQAISLTMDLFPTLLAAAGISIEHEIDARSLLPTLLGEEKAVEERDLFFHRREGGLRYGGRTIEALRRGDWKLLQNSPFAPQELYNLRTDPRETTNLTKTEPKKYRELAAALRRHRQRSGSVPWQRP